MKMLIAQQLVSAINDVEIITCHLEDLYPYLSSSLDLTITLLKMFNDNCNHLTQLLKWAQTYDRFEKVAAFLYELSATNNIEKNLLFGDIPYISSRNCGFFSYFKSYYHKGFKSI